MSYNSLYELKAADDQLAANLAGNQKLTDTQKQAIIGQINALKTTQIDVTNALGDVKTISSVAPPGVLGTITTALDQNRELAESRVTDLENKKNMAVRSAEINTYYKQSYMAYFSVLKIVVIGLAVVFILFGINQYLPLPEIVLYIGIIITIVVTAILAYIAYHDIQKRDNTFFDKYNHSPPKDTSRTFSEPKEGDFKSKFDYNTFYNSLGGSDCTGADCCGEGIEYNVSEHKCCPLDYPNYDETSGKCVNSSGNAAPVSESTFTLLKDVNENVVDVSYPQLSNKQYGTGLTGAQMVMGLPRQSIDELGVVPFEKEGTSWEPLQPYV